MGIETAMFDYYPLSPLLRGDFEEVFLPLDVPDMVEKVARNFCFFECCHKLFL